jgi:hypothetical protein
MRAFLILLALCFGLAAHAQPANDAKPGDEQNTRGAKTDASTMDPATKARVRVEGVPGGTGARVPPEATGGATVGSGDQHRHSPPTPPDPQRDEPRSDQNRSDKKP